MKNRFHLLATAVVSLLCVSCAETQVSQSGSEKAVNPPIMGWSSWNAFRVDISEDIIKNQADLMVKKGLKDAGYHYINIDDGFFGERDGNGKMQTNKNRFPNGMKPVADHIHSLGMKAGIYTDAGNNTCGSIWDNDHAGVGAGIYGHEQQDAQLYFGDWGFDFIKIDYCGGDVLGLNEQERYTSIRNSIDKVNKADAVIFQTEKQLKDLGDKFPADKRAAVETALNELKEAHKAQNIDAIDPAIDKLNAALQTAAQDIYNAQQQAGGAQQGAGFDPNAGAQQGGNANNNGDTVQDADFEEVK